MVGQKQLLQHADALLERKGFPQFSIIIGPVGSGKKTIAQHIAKKLTENVVVVDNKIDTVREVIKTAYTTSTPTTFIFADSDRASISAKNAMLKLFEEPPKNMYFILTACNTAFVLNTVESRGRSFQMLPYSRAELREYLYNVASFVGHFEIKDEDIEFILSVADTPGDINELLSYDLKEFKHFVTLVATKIDKCSGANSFKIADKVNLKDDATKYSLRLFFEAFTAYCIDHYDEDIARYLSGITITASYVNNLATSDNKQMLFDCWILEIRARWLLL